MTENQLKTRAAHLMNRLNAMGFQKDGKPMVIDQAYELVAAEEGLRNQHVLRTKLAPEPAVDRASEMQAYFDWGCFIERQGWNEESQLIHALGFIGDQGLMVDFVGYAEKAAAEESAFESHEDASEEVLAVLKEVGYEVKPSDFKQPYWEFDGEGSVDFDTVDEAWHDAWLDAQARVVSETGISREAWNAKPLAERLSWVQKSLSTCEEDTQRKAAEMAYQDYDFGAMVVGTSGWESSTGDNILTRTVFLESDIADAPSVAMRFAVEVENGEVVNTYVSKR